MGDQANVQFTDSTERVGFDPPPVVNLYAHWAGGELFAAVQQALDSQPARARWDDPPYCTRIVVHRTLELLGANTDDDAGFGLWTSVDDNEHDILIVDFADGGVVTLGAGRRWEGFDQFCEVHPDILRAG